jgi:hypothetical protein
MRQFYLILLLASFAKNAMAEGKQEDLVVPSTDEAVCVQQIQPIIDLWKNNPRTVKDADRLIKIQKEKGNCAAQNAYRKMLGFS